MVERQKYEEKMTTLDKVLKIKNKQLVDYVRCCSEEIELKKRSAFKIQNI